MHFYLFLPKGRAISTLGRRVLEPGSNICVLNSHRNNEKFWWLKYIQVYITGALLGWLDTIKSALNLTQQDHLTGLSPLYGERSGWMFQGQMHFPGRGREDGSPIVGGFGWNTPAVSTKLLQDGDGAPRKWSKRAARGLPLCSNVAQCCQNC